MSIPPLHKGILHTRINRVALESVRHWVQGNDQVVKDVQNCDGNNRGNVEPERDIHVPLTALVEGHKEVDTEECDPHHRNQKIDGPFEFSVFFALGVT